MLDPRPIVMLDLNGVCHRYSKGWQNTAPLYDPPTDGFKEWVESVQGEFRVVVWPTHMNTPRDVRRIKQWFKKHDLHRLDLEVVPHPLRGLKLKIDDRAVQFTGNWADYPPERLRNFTTWSGR